jgi:multisubunit Na+/H+ antiporter MnhE subunit
MADGIPTRRSMNWRTLPPTLARALAGFFPVSVFALVLLWMMGERGVLGGMIAGTVLGAVAAWALTRLIAAYPLVQWVAAIVVALLLVLVIASLF